MRFLTLVISIMVFSFLVDAQSGPIAPAKPYVVKTGKQVADLAKELASQDGNKNQDIVAAGGMQMRVAVFHDELRENDNFEVHNASDDIYYVLDGKATLALGGSLLTPNEISPGEWRSKSATGTQKVEVKKGDLVVVPRGTVHQRTVTGKGFSMVLIKIFENRQP
ncbi:MAG: hypothetical protein KIT61_15345 [Pyrinomonadaceae bacterium]|nr:hypothetical protein [Blastocatellia bacterium]MCW5957961.1 hypothetical protein [Pyrinomonadaceae bacterium]